MKKLIFGCGYVGRRVAAAWVDQGDDVFAVTRSLQNADSFRDFGVRPIVADLCDSHSLHHLPEVDVILHSVGFDRNSGKTREEVSLGGMANVLAAIGRDCKRFIFVSSTSVYGQFDGEWVDEDSACNPLQPGGQVCVQAETLVKNHFRDIPFASACVLRLAGIYGPGRLLSRVDALMAGTPLAGNGDSWLNLIHVDDAVAAILACEQSRVPDECFIAVDDRPIQRSEYFERLARLTQAPAPTFDASQPSARGSGGLNKRCRNRKLREQLGWSPKYPSIETGLPAAIDAG